MKPNHSSLQRLARREARRLMRRSRRRGQALLLAVLLMVFAALLGATMITLVSSNLNQTTRQGGISGARASSSAAITFVNDRLTNSIQGDLWRPWMDNQPPLKAVNAAAFNAYYTPFEQAQGWVNEVDFSKNAAGFYTAPTGDLNGNGVTYAQAVANGDTREQLLESTEFFDRQILPLPVGLGKRCYVKLPDPRGPVTNANGPQYLVQVRPTTEGALEMSVVGTNEDEAGAFDIRKAFKPTSRYQGPFYYARVDSNYNYNRKSLTRTKLRAAALSGTTTLDVEDTVGLTAGRAIVIGDDATNARSAVIQTVAANTLTLSAPITVAYSAGATVTAASILMDGIMSGTDPTAFDADGDGTRGNAWETTVPPMRYSNTTPVPTPGARSQLINGGVLTEGKARISLSATDRLKVAGFIAPLGSAIVPAKQIEVVDPGAPTTPSALPESNDTTTVRNALQLRVLDNRGAQSTHVQPLTPPSIDGTESRYREMTQYDNPSAGSAHGYAHGVYINNTGDIDRFDSAQQLSTYQSHQMYANRAPYAYTTPVAGTLEQRRRRGWVSPWVFLPRGTQVELAGDKIIFTRDDRSDNAAYLDRPDPSKAWMNTGGTALTTPGASTYRMVLDVNTGQRSFGAPGAEVAATGTVPFNGVIFLEGNARVRGFLKKGTVTGRDITLVSMGTIFVEGSIVRDATDATTIATPGNAPRIALLAKRDVVLNLSQMVAPLPGSQDFDVAAPNVALATDASAVNTDFEVAAADAARFRVGDIVRAATDRDWHQVTGINGTTLTLLPAPAANPARVAGVRVIRLSDPELQVKAAADLPSTTDGLRTVYELDPTQEQAFARDVRRDGLDLIDDAGAAVAYQLSWLHGGQRVEAGRVRRDHGGTGTFSIKKNTLPAATPDTVVSGAPAPNNEKVLTLSAGDRPAPTPIDLLNVNSNATREGDTTETLALLQNNATFQDNGPTDPADWKFTPNTTFAAAPARRLAGVGTTAAPPDDASVAQGGDYSVPLTLGGRRDFQINWLAGTSSIVPPSTAAALRIIGSSIDPVENDDLETSREDFYQLNLGATPAQAPIRWSAGAPTAFAPSATGHNALAFTNDTSVRTAGVPKYWVSALKVEADSFAATPHAFQAVPVHVQATIFAQQGSWSMVTPALHDVDDDRNGTPNEAADNSAATRYRRWNYHVFVRGSIVQNYTPSGLTDFDATSTPIPGSMLGWLNALSYPKNIETGAATPPALPEGRGRDWQTIEYQADPVPFYNGLYLPPTPDLLYTS